MKTVEDIIKEKEFHQLSQVERLEVLQMVEDENEFMEVKRFLLSLETLHSNEETAPIEIAAKNNLDALFAQKHPVISVISETIHTKESEKERKIIPLYRKLLWPAMVASVFSFGMFIAVKSWNSSLNSGQNVQANNSGKKPQKTVQPTIKEIPKVEEAPLIAKVEKKQTYTLPIIEKDYLENDSFEMTDFERVSAPVSPGMLADLKGSFGIDASISEEAWMKDSNGLGEITNFETVKPTIEEMLNDIVTAF